MNTIGPISYADVSMGFGERFVFFLLRSSIELHTTFLFSETQVLFHLLRGRRVRMRATVRVWGGVSGGSGWFFPRRLRPPAP